MIAMPKRLCLGAALTSVLGTAAAAAEALKAPPEDAVGEEIEQVFDLPVDFTVPPATRAIDASRFAAAAKGWSGKLDADTASGAAWATLSGPTRELPGRWDKAAVTTRIDPQQQGKLGVTLSRAVPLGDVAVTWQNGYK